MNTQTKEEIQARIDVLSDEMDANEEENRAMQEELNGLYKQLDSMKDPS
jgi:chaperonin cofactor prefoldin